MAPFFFVILVALETNSPIAAYWLIVLNLQREDGLKLLTDEVDEAITSWKRQHPGQEMEDHLYEIVTTADLPLLTSTIRETLRYTASIASIRRVTEPAELGGYRLNVGDEVACLARLVHFDEEIHENASEYDPMRYMTEKRLSKNGKTVVNHTMPWGGGVSMCPGRFVDSFIDLLCRQRSESTLQAFRDHRTKGFYALPPHAVHGRDRSKICRASDAQIGTDWYWSHGS